MPRPRWLLALVLLVPAAAAPGAIAETTEERERYVLATGPLERAACSAPANLGGACFELPAGTDEVHLTVEDDQTGPAAFEWRLENADGSIAFGSAFSCGQDAVPFPDPEDFVVERIRVTVLAPGFADLFCPFPAIATQGTITAAFLSS